MPSHRVHATSCPPRVTRSVRRQIQRWLTAHKAMCDSMCGGDIMATNLQLDDRLIKEAVTLGNHRTKKAAVTQALADYIRHLRQERILDLFGKMDFDPGYNYKRQRARA